jgi:hypothetical protein
MNYEAFRMSFWHPFGDHSDETAVGSRALLEIVELSLSLQPNLRLAGRITEKEIVCRTSIAESF